ncbi:MAG: hypothetical protein Q9218_000551 [Villophora microphyllina]
MDPISPLPPAHHHPAPLQTLIPYLIPLLPNSLPLLRRIQFQPANSDSSSPFPNAHVFATFPPSPPPPSTPPEPLDLKNPPKPPFEFAAAWVDRSRAPETECWIFSTYEVREKHLNLKPFPSVTEVQDGGGNERIDRESREREGAEEARLQLLAVLNAIASLPGRREEDNEILVIGTLHASLLPLLTSPTDNILPFQRVLSRSRPGQIFRSPIDPEDDGVLSGIGQSTYKYLIPPPPSPPPGEEETPLLPPGYSIGQLTREDLSTCIANTDIPRTEATLAMLVNACVRYYLEGAEAGLLVAWAFLGADGSLNSLHTMPGHRGKGLAAAVVRRLMKGMLDEGDEEKPFGEGKRQRGDGWMCSDVYWDNEGGKGVAKGLGGREGWVDHWVGCDLRAVRRVWRRLDGETG